MLRCNHEDSVAACSAGPTTTSGPPTNGDIACDTMLTDENDHLAPDPDDCQVYYVCQPDGNGGYIPHERVCRDGTGFDDEAGRCVSRAALGDVCGMTQPVRIM